MTYVIQMPHSSTNPTDKFTLVLYSDWLAYVNEEAWKLPVAAEYDTYAEAAEAKATLNAANAPLAPHGGCNWEGCKECFPRK